VREVIQRNQITDYPEKDRKENSDMAAWHGWRILYLQDDTPPGLEGFRATIFY
jgi:hypothetical protein